MNLELALGIAIIGTAYLVRGMAGFGSGLIAIPLLSLWWPVSLVVPLVVTLDLLASATQSGLHRQAIRWPEVLRLLPFALLGVAIGLWLFSALDAALLKRALGGFVLLYAIYNLWAPAMPAASSWWCAPAGLGAGLIGTLFGTGGPFYVAYLKARALDKQAFRATFACIFLLDAPLRVAGYISTGLTDQESLRALAVALPVMFVGLYLGARLHQRISPEVFNRAISVLLLGSGVALML